MRLPRPTAIEWLCLAGGLLLTLHYAWLLDDAYVYFRYVDNWVLLGRGLVYNPGEYAEGYTSPLWLLLLAGLRSAGLELWLAVRGVGLLSFAVFWLLAVVINRELSPPHAPIVDLPLALLSFNYGVLCYFTSGTEGPLVQLAAAGFVLFALRPEWVAGQVALGLFPLVRPELGLALLAGVAWARLRTGRWPWAALATGLMAGGGWLLFRIVYYADLFPVTFYLKNVSDFSQGLRYLHDAFGPYHLYELMLAAGLLLVWFGRRPGTRGLALGPRGFVFATVLVLVLYTVKVGGDARHFRYLAFSFCAIVLALGGLAERPVAALTARRSGPWAPTAAALAMLLAFTSLPRQLAGHPALDRDQTPSKVDGIADAQHHRTHPGLVVPDPWVWESPIDLRPRYAEWRASGGSDPLEKVRRHKICFKSYTAFDAWAVQSYGLTDAVLARTQVPPERPGHKTELLWLAPDLVEVLRWWGKAPEPGMYRAAVEAGVAPDWIARNLKAFELLERKLYNRHDPVENLLLALQTGVQIEPGVVARPIPKTPGNQPPGPASLPAGQDPPNRHEVRRPSG